MSILRLRSKQQAAAVAGRGIGWLKTFLLQLMIALSLMAIPDIVKAVTRTQDVDALRALHTAWSGKPSFWDTSKDPCDDQWLGIWCDVSQTHVVQMLLVNQDLAGTLSPALGNLTNLRILDLSSNPKLGGTLPAEMGKLTQLQRFYVQFCNLSGPIPSNIGNMTSLQYLGLSQNSLTGPLPATIGLLKEMIWLDVSCNHLNGSLPMSATTGIGSGLDNLTKARHIHLQNNTFSGSIPSAMFSTKMKMLHLLLRNNEFTGSIPSTIENMLHLDIICLDSNFLNGTVPSTISTITNLTTLQLDNNNLTGQLPDLSNNTKLQILTVGNNRFEASEIPSWITNLRNLYLLSMDSANLTGSIPAEIFKFSPNLTNVMLGSNQLNGTLDLTSANLSSLLLVDLKNNNITNLDRGNYTQKLLLDGNPYCISNPTECTPAQSSEPPAASPSPSTAIASECMNECPSEYKINPRDSGSCLCARPVVVTWSFYATKIPHFTINSIAEMEQEFMIGWSKSESHLGITLQDTQLVVDIVSDDVVNISVFPPNTETRWSPINATLISYVLENQDIWFTWIGPMSCGLRGSPYNELDVVEKKLSTGAKIAIGIGVAVLGIVILVLGVYAMKLRRRAVKAEKLNKPFAAWIAADREDTADIPQLKGARWFSLEEMRKCTNNFSDSNEIGAGGYGKVYKGFLSSGDRVAIKRAGTSTFQGAAEFKNEIELLSRVHHMNLVALVGFCFEEGEKMLVYEYMPNGTLRECLSGKTGLRMDWDRRIGVALGSANGIAYLHTHANPPIIHGDIKSSNILLDEKLVARVADFGLSKLAPADGDGVASMSTQIKGTKGYMDPEYYMTNQLTDKSDVYSFGVVLLEVVTGRPPIQRGKHIVHEVKTALAKGGMDLVVQNWVDPDLTDYPLKAVERVVKVALNCVQDDPAKRLTMAEVVKELEALVQMGPAEAAMDIDMSEERFGLYGEGSPHIEQSYDTSSFEYTSENTSSFESSGMYRPLKPE